MDEKKRTAAFSELHRGMTFGFYARNGYYGSPEARAEVDRMAAANVKWVVLIATVMRDTWHSTRQYRDFIYTPDDGELRGIIDYIHSKGMKVKLRPMLEALDGTQRFEVFFYRDEERFVGMHTTDCADFFASMTARSVHYARIAQETGCEMYSIDSEIDKIIWANDHWKGVIQAIRQVYDGPVTSCHTHATDLLKEVQRKDHWWYDLDMLTTSYYAQTRQPGESVDQMIESFQPWLQRYRAVAAEYGKPIAFGECGCTSMVGGGLHTRFPTLEDRFDATEQANYMEAALRTFWEEPWWYGMYWWKWDEQNDRPNYRGDPAGDKGLTIAGKPAEQVLKRWYAREDVAR